MTATLPGSAHRPVSGRAWATMAFLLGIGVSVAANVAHTYYPTRETLKASGLTADQWRPQIGAQAMSAFYPVALLLVVEVLSRAPWPRSLGWSAARYGGASVVAGVAAVVSYRHMAALLAAYGEDTLTCAIGPLAVDGLMVVASFALLALGKARRTPTPTPKTGRRTVRETVRARWLWIRRTPMESVPEPSGTTARTDRTPDPDPSGTDPSGGPKTDPKTVRTRSRTGKQTDRKTGKRSVPDVDELMPLGWRIVADLDARGTVLKRDTLAAELRAAGQQVSSEKVGALLARLKTEAPTDPADPAIPDVTAAPAAKGDDQR